MPEVEIALGEPAVASLFPFHFCIDRDLRIRACGRSLKRLFGCDLVGDAFADRFELERPSGTPTFERFAARLDAAVSMTAIPGKVRLRGQVVPLASTPDMLMFVGGPWIASVEELQSTSLSVRDFAATDPTLDLLYMGRAKMVALADARKFGEERDAQVVTAEKLRVLSQSLADANVKLATALASAEESQRARSAFLASVTHELRTPLNAIINVPEGLLQDFRRASYATCGACRQDFDLEPGEAVDATAACPGCGATGTMARAEAWTYEGDPKETSEYLELIRRAGGHLLSVVNDILDISRLEAGRVEIQLESVRLGRLVADAIGTVSPIAAQNGVRIVVEPFDARGELFVDPLRVSQILINLLNNAIKFSPAGSDIHLRAEADASLVTFAVEDRGIGVAKEHQEAIFDSFRQIDSSHTRRTGGSGLGLSIARHLAQLHGGRVWVESALGEGSTFYVTLQRRAGECINATPLPAAPLSMTPPSPRKYTARVLVIDDDPAAFGTAKLVLSAAGYDVSVLEDSRSALAVIDTLRPDVVLLDVKMPHLDGVTLLAMLRQQSATGNLPVILSSAYEDDRDDGAAPQETLWLPKPWRPGQLAAHVESLLRSSRHAGGGES